jgi:hypothetical protein
MARFFNLQNVSYPEYISHRRIVAFDHICHRCHWTERRTLEVPYVRDGNGHTERIYCGGNCRNEHFEFTVHVEGSDFDW